MSKVVYPDAGEVTMTYNENGTLATRIDQRKWKTTYSYDEQVRVTQETVTAEQGADPASVQGTRNVRYSYDALGRLTKVEDDNGQGNGGPDYDFSKVEYTYTWSTTSQLVEEKHTFDGKGPWTVKSTTDDVGVRSSLEYPHASGESYRTLSFTHDALQRLTAITEGGNTIGDYSYKGLYLQDRGIGNSNGSRIVKLTFKTTNDLDGYDAWGRIETMRHYKVDGGADRAKYGYAYDYASSRKYQEDQVNATTDELYGYDTLHRLTSFERGDLNANKDAITGTPAREQDWTLEVISNWDAIVSKTNGNDDSPYDARTHNTVNEITALDPQGAVGSFNLDWGEGASKSGNLYILPDRTDPTNKADRFTYDYRNRLIKVEHTNNYGGSPPTWSTVVTYYYDGLNRRVKKDLNTGTDVIYLYDACPPAVWRGWQVLEEREWDTNGEGPEDDKWEPRRQFVYGATYIDEVLIFDKDTDDDGDCTDAGGSSRYFYAQQANWNVVAVTDSSGDTAEKIKYDPYSEAAVTVQDGHSTTGNAYLFQSRRWDDEVDLYYFRNRVVSPTLGRFITRDPVGYVDGYNLYAYASGRPTFAVDPMGMLCAMEIAGPDLGNNWCDCVDGADDWWDWCSTCAGDELEACLAGADTWFQLCMRTCAGEGWEEKPWWLFRVSFCREFVCGVPRELWKKGCQSEYAVEISACVGAYAAILVFCDAMYKGPL